MTFFLTNLLYIKIGDPMTIYIDLVFIINFILDFYILSGVKFLLKLKTKFLRIILGSLVGSISLFILFFKLSTLELNILKIILSVLMILVTFGKKDFLRNFFYLYVVSIVLGGTIYLINDSLDYKVNNFLFLENGYSINIIILIIISPIIIYLYVKEFLKLKKLINTTFNITIKFKNKELNLQGFLDTGNKLIDPYFHRPIILVNKKYISLKGRKIIYVPFNSLNNNGLLKCITCEYILIEERKVNNVLIGISENNLGVDCILNERLFDI